MVVAEGMGDIVTVGGRVDVGIIVDEGNKVGVSTGGKVGACVKMGCSFVGASAVSVAARFVSWSAGFENGRLQPASRKASRLKREGMDRIKPFKGFNLLSLSFLYHIRR